MINFTNEQQFAEYIKLLGGRAYIVGGRVRNKIMNIDLNNDEDYVITGLNVEDVPFEKIVGTDAPVFLVEVNNKKCEIAVARAERKNGNGYNGFIFYSNKYITIEEDLFRRDITINSIAEDILNGNIIDPWGGINDIKNKIIRHTSNAFSEDPLRIYRVARFASIFSDYNIDNYTFIIMSKIINELNYIKPERVYKEFKKILSPVSVNPRRFFDILLKLKCLNIHFKEINDLLIPDMHDGTVYNHTMNLLKYGTNKLIRFGLLCHDFDKAKTPVESHPHHYNHDNLGDEPIMNFCNRLKIPTKLQKFALICSSEHMRIKNINNFKKHNKIINFVKNNKYIVDELLEVSYIDSYYRDNSDKYKINCNFDKIFNKICCVYNAINNISGDVLLAEGYTEGKKLYEELCRRHLTLYRKCIKNEIY